MNLKIISQKEEPLLSRIHVNAKISFDKATPTKADVAKQIASALKKDEKTVVIRLISTKYGLREADVDAVVYDSEKEKEKIEVKPSKQKGAAPAAPKEQKK